MLDNEFVILVVDGDGAESLHGALTEQQRCLLALDHGGIHVVQNRIANLYLTERDNGTLIYLAVSHLIVALALDVFLGQVAILEHEVGFYG